MFNSLSDTLQETLKKLRGHGKLTEKNISEALREVRLALLEADVEFSAAKAFIAEVKEKSLGEKVLKSIKPGEQIVKIFHDELKALLGGDVAPLNLDPPARILIVGLNGAGKTTTSAKLALHLQKQGKRPLLVACDLHRPAAVAQLATLAQQISVPLFKPETGEKNLLKVAQQSLQWIDQQNGNAVIFDTAGRQEIDEELIGELKELHRFLTPGETLLVADSATGQQAVNVAKRFDEAVGITGLILTKLDGDARGGAALSMRSVTGKPIKFAGVGEKLSQLEAFDPDRMAGRILGMGDIVGLVSAAAEAIDENEALRMAEKMQKATFDFEDFLSQMRMMKKMGGLASILGMIPGMNKQMKGMSVDDKALRHTEAIILSMTPKERTRPEIINASRRKRIARGSGTSLTRVNQLIKQFSQMRKLMKNKGKMKEMMRQFGGGGGGKKGGFPFGF